MLHRSAAACVPTTASHILQLLVQRASVSSVAHVALRNIWAEGAIEGNELSMEVDGHRITFLVPKGQLAARHSHSHLAHTTHCAILINPLALPISKLLVLISHRVSHVSALI